MDSVSGKTFPTINPATGEKVCDVAEGDKVCKNIIIKLFSSTQHLEMYAGGLQTKKLI